MDYLRERLSEIMRAGTLALAHLLELQEQEHKKKALDCLPKADLFQKIQVELKEQNFDSEPQPSMPYYKEGTVFQRKNGRYEARIYFQGRQLYVKSGNNREAVTKALHQAIRNKRNGQLQIKEKKAPAKTLGAWLNQWIVIYKEPFLKESSLNSIYQCLKKHIPQEIKAKPLTELTGMLLQDMLNKISFPRQREITGIYLTEALKTAKQNELIKKEIWQGLKFKSQKNHKTITLSKEDEQKLYAFCPQPLADIIFGFLWTGARRNELLTLMPEDIDFQKETIHLKGTKREGADRIIPLFSPLKERLLTMPKQSPVFGYRNPNSLQHDFKEAVDRCGLKEITLHTLRHTFASRRLAEGVPMKAIQIWLGHKSYKTTADIYAHESPEFLKKAVSIVEDQRRKGPEKSH